MKCIRQTAFIIAVAVLLPVASLAEKAQKDPPEVTEIIEFIHAYYGNDSKKFWAINSKFEHPQYGSLVEVQDMMTDRQGENDVPIAIDGIPVMGKSKTIKEELGEITYRAESAGDELGTTMYIFTAWVNRVIDFVYDGGRQEVTRKVVLKAYVQVRDGKFITIYSNETVMEKSYKKLFADQEKAKHKSGLHKHNN